MTTTSTLERLQDADAEAARQAKSATIFQTANVQSRLSHFNRFSHIHLVTTLNGLGIRSFLADCQKKEDSQTNWPPFSLKLQ
mmetsp:Transcript_9122/g.30070  ORF Transcript_9122/g.30070 Transcript_9122/m.30070 type:complete len:82 (+) Transcript_9122:3356-3601(+)